MTDETRGEPGSQSGDAFQSALRDLAEVVTDFLGLKPEEVAALGIAPENDFISEAADREAHLHRVQRLLGDPALRGALRVIRETPEAWYRVGAMLERADELRQASSVPGDLHRQLTPLLSGIVLSDRANAVLLVARERAAQRESDELARRIRSGRVYSHELVIGSGWHGTVYNNAMLGKRSVMDTITMDARPWIGGQFARTPGASHLLNSRVRPERPDLLNRPGTEGSLNSMGMAPLQQADVETMSYGNQGRFGEVISVVQQLVRPTLLDHTVRWIRTSVDDPSLVEVTVRDNVTGEWRETVHDRVIVPSGIGEVATPFEFGIDLIEEQRKLPLNERAILTYDEHIELTGDADNLFPNQGFEETAVVGDADGGRITVGKLTGHETSSGMSVINLDFPRVGWYGQRNLTARTYLGDERPRYHAIGLTLPRPETDKDYFFQTEPFNERVVGFEREMDGLGQPTGKIVVVAENRDTGRETRRAWKRVVLASGFVDRTMQTLSTLEPTTYQSLVESGTAALQTPGVRVRTSFGAYVVDCVDVIRDADLDRSVTMLTVLEKTDRGIVERQRTVEDFTDLVSRLADEVEGIDVPREAPLQAVRAEFDREARTVRGTAALTAAFDSLAATREIRWMSDGTTFDAYGVDDDGLRLAIEQGLITSAVIPANRMNAMESVANENVAFRVGNTSVYLAGAAAPLPVSPTESADVPALVKIPANTKSGFRFVPRDEVFVQMMARSDRSESRAIPSVLDAGEVTVLPPAKVRVASSEARRLRVASVDVGKTSTEFVIEGDPDAYRTATMPRGCVWADLMALVAAEADEYFGIAPDYARATVEYTRGDDPQRWNVSAKTSGDKFGDNALAAIASDPLTLRIASRILKVGVAGTVAARLTLEVEDGALDVPSVAVRATRNREVQPRRPKSAGAPAPARGVDF